MDTLRRNAPAGGIRCRQIEHADVVAVAALLARGFPAYDRDFWLGAFARLSEHDAPPDCPKYGYLLECDDAVVGAILLICSALPTGGLGARRCNLSSWYVEPRFRPYAPLLVSQALRHKDVTYLNISPAPHTGPIVEAQGFSRYCEGTFIAATVFNGLFDDTPVEVFEPDRAPDVEFDPAERELLLQHQAYGCVSVWCATPKRAHGFVFRPSRTKFIPSVRLIYCRDVDDFVRFAGPIGRFLAGRGRMLVAIDANDPIPGLFGVFLRGKAPKYFKGAQRPRLGDIAYTEYAMLGV
jgi:hypothetical protein